MKLYRPPVPGTFRVTLVATLVTAGALALYRGDHADRWIAIATGVSALLLLVWWRGQFVTDTIGRWFAMLARRLRRRTPSEAGEVAVSPTDARTTVVLELETAAPGQDVPLDAISSYLDRYGVRCSSIRVTSADIGDDARRTWVSLTVSAADNLSALQARSPQIPLRRTAEVAARRLADHLRELGWTAQITESPGAPLETAAKEKWRAVSDDRGYLATYQVTVDGSLPETLESVWTSPAAETWTVAELSGEASSPSLVLVCAVRTSEAPATVASTPALRGCGGRQLATLDAMNPLSTKRFGQQGSSVTVSALAELRWPAESKALFAH